MGDIFKTHMFDMVANENIKKPIFYCSTPEKVAKEAVSVSIPLAKEFQKQSSEMMKTMRLESNLQSVIATLGEKPVIKDFDVLFNPAYKTDVIKALISVCRKKQFSVIWPGRYEDGKLYYAEEGYQDYKVYDIANYDITVIV